MLCASAVGWSGEDARPPAALIFSARISGSMKLRLRGPALNGTRQRLYVWGERCLIFKLRVHDKCP